MITVNFYSFSKKPNSTKRPTGSGAAMSCVLKDATSLIAPEIELDYNGNPTSYNYCHISTFGRWYFITDWTYNRGLWTASLSIDLLGTYKGEIGEAELYVLRSAYSYDGSVQDSYYPIKTDPDISFSDGDFGFAGSLSAGHYVVGIVSKSYEGGPAPVSQGSVRYFVFTQSQMQELIDKLYSPSSYTDWDPTYRYYYNPLQYIVSSRWFPVSPPVTTELPYMTTSVGWSSVTAPSYALAEGYAEYTVTFAIPKHPDASDRGAYLNHAPYSEYMLTAGPFGEIPLDSAVMGRSDTLTLTLKLDFITGIAELIGQAYISATVGSAVEVFRRSSQIGVDITLAQISRNGLGTALGLGNAALSAGLAVAGDITQLTGVASGVVSAFEASIPKMMSAGVNGATIGSLGSYIKPRLYSRFYRQTEEDRAEHGRPLCQIKEIDTIPGYILCADVDIEIPGTESEIRGVKAALESGFFYE